LTVALADLFGPIKGVSTLAAATSIAPAIGAYLVLRSQRLGWIAVILAGFLAVGRPTGEATAWGGYPQLLGLGLSVLALLSVDRYLRSEQRTHAIFAGVLLALDLATSHLTGLFTLAAGAVVVALHVVQRHRDRTVPRPHWRTSWLLLAPSIVLIPIYWRLLPALAHEIPGPSAPNIGDAGIGGTGPFWIVGVAAILVTPLLLWRRRHETLWILTTSTALVTALTYAITREPRLLYFGPLAAIFAVATWLHELGSHSTEWIRATAAVATLILTVALAAQTVNSFGLFRLQRAFYDIAPPGTLAATTWLRTSTPRNAVIAVTPIGGAPLGWWVEGLTQHPTYTDASPAWLAYPQERARARAADAIFSSTFPDATSLHTARRLGVQYLFVAKTWEGYQPQQMRIFEGRHPHAVDFEDASVAVLHTTGQ
jgi:hypothetical protein